MYSTYVFGCILETRFQRTHVFGFSKDDWTIKPRVLVNTLYKSLVRPHLDYCSQAWRLHLRKDIDTLDKVQRRASRILNFEAGPMTRD